MFNLKQFQEERATVYEKRFIHGGTRKFNYGNALEFQNESLSLLVERVALQADKLKMDTPRDADEIEWKFGYNSGVSDVIKLLSPNQDQK